MRPLVKLAVIALLAVPLRLAAAEQSFPARVEEAASAFAGQPGVLAGTTEDQRKRLVVFLTGNIVFTLAHEFGHVVISEFGLPVLGREEDAADNFATLTLVQIGGSFAHQVMVDAARGLLVLGRDDARAGANDPVKFYDEHGLGPQRAGQIICLLYGSDPTAFEALARRAYLPDERRDSCAADFQQMSETWRQLLAPNLGRAGQSLWQRLFRRGREASPAGIMPVTYGEAPENLKPIRSFLVRLGLLETVRDYAVQNFAFRPGIRLEAASCGEPNAWWDPEERKLTLCYELVVAMLPAAIETINNPQDTAPPR
ncbi:MAG: DUF4344 domain-containing metallopeptidase [Proteobacteria bacterium]|nr:DUF4344 domain-containing metallopeptidase [Pseudomonadota bacterium]